MRLAEAFRSFVSIDSRRTLHDFLLLNYVLTFLGPPSSPPPSSAVERDVRSLPKRGHDLLVRPPVSLHPL